jgi:signal transduction histidine kinase
LALLLIAILVPFVANIIFVLKPFGINPKYDLTTLMFVFTAVIFMINILKYKFLNLSFIARNDIFDELSDALIVLNENNELIDCNKSALKLAKNLGIKVCNKGSNMGEFFKNTKISLENDSEFSLKNPEINYQSSVKKMVINDSPVGIILSIKDVTKIKELEKMKAQAKQEKEINNLREEFITRVSHELRQPLMPIIGYSNELKSMVKGKKANEFIEKIIINSENLKELVEKTIKLSQLKSKMKENLEKRKISQLLENTAKDERIKIEIINDSEILIDQSQMLEALNNLIDNALKYSKKEVIIKANKEGKNSIIEIIDAGKGIKKETIDELLKGSYLAKIDASELRKGFGIGFLISKTIIQSYNGEIEIKSQEGKGTKITIKMPSN